MKQNLIVVFFVFFCFLFCINSIESKKRPHIVLFVIDDLGWTDLGYREGSEMLTPYLNEIASTGIILDRYYTQPVCSPSRSALMQGLYPFRTGMQHYTTIKPASTAHMPLDKPTIAELMKKAKYQTHIVGKWHLGYASFNYTPTCRGFQSHEGYYQGMIDYYNKTFEVPNEYLPGTNIIGYDWWKNRTINKEVFGEYNLFLMENATNNILNEYYNSNFIENDNPLFLYFAHQIVHVPLEVPQSYQDRCSHIVNDKRRIYCGMLAALDDSIKKLIDNLKSKNMWDDTLLLVTTDNGGDPNYGSFPESAGCNFPLRAGKGRLFEGGVRSIGFINGGDNVIPSSQRGSTIDGLAHMVDWMPTILSFADSENLIPDGIDGNNLYQSILNNEPTNREHIPLDINLKIGIPDAGKQYSIVTKDGWKLVYENVKGGTLNYDGYYPCPNYTPNSTVIQADVSSNGTYLFNIFDDPSEKNNLYSRYPERVEQLEELLQEVMKQGYQNPQPNPFDPRGLPTLHKGIWAPFLSGNC